MIKPGPRVFEKNGVFYFHGSGNAVVLCGFPLFGSKMEKERLEQKIDEDR